MASIELEHVTVASSGRTLLDDVSLLADDGELIGVIGLSGAGKTTLLRVIAGLTDVAAGRIRIGGVDVTAAEPGQRGVAFVAQSPALFSHLDVHDNISFPLSLRHQRPADIENRVSAETRALHIEGLLGRSPRNLSAGEAQLVQVARALVRMPALLLLDEPLAHLDTPLAQQMRVELRVLQQGYGVTAFVATNDPIEAMALPDRLVVLDAGRVVQVGSPIDVYRQPATLVAAACTGNMATTSARVEADVDGFWLVHRSFRRRAWRPSLAAYVGASVVVGVRPTGATVTEAGDVAATVVEVCPPARTITVTLAPDGDRVEVATAPFAHRVGDQVALRIDEFTLFDPVTGDRLP